MARSKRGLASADQSTRERVSRMGGQSSRGGGRQGGGQGKNDNGGGGKGRGRSGESEEEGEW